MLENVRCEKDLGVLTDHKLNFDFHIAEKIKKANSMLAIIKKCSMKLNCQSLNVLIKTLVRPHLEYCNQGVGGSRSKERDRKSELVLRSTYQIFEWDRNNSDRNFYNVVRYVHIPLVP